MSPGTGGAALLVPPLAVPLAPVPGLECSLSEFSAWSTAILSTSCWSLLEIPVLLVLEPCAALDVVWLPGTTTMLCLG